MPDLVFHNMVICGREDCTMRSTMIDARGNVVKTTYWRPGLVDSVDLDLRYGIEDFMGALAGIKVHPVFGFRRDGWIRRLFR